MMFQSRSRFTIAFSVFPKDTVDSLLLVSGQLCQRLKAFPVRHNRKPLNIVCDKGRIVK